MVPLVAVTLAQVAVIATSVYLHRGIAHRALQLHPVMDVCFRAALWLTTGQSRREWVAVHRKHHAFTDREGDPHSPRVVPVPPAPEEPLLLPLPPAPPAPDTVDEDVVVGPVAELVVGDPVEDESVVVELVPVVGVPVAAVDDVDDVEVEAPALVLP